jgi:hypothetical protein
MPIVIDEVVISIEISNHASGGAATPPSETEANQTLVAECVERVLDILAQRQER